MNWVKVGNLSGKDGKRGDDAKPVDLDAVAAMVLQRVPAPVNGKDADADLIAARVLEKVLRSLEAVPAPRDGKDADPAFVRSVVQEEVSRVTAALPIPKDGRDYDPEVLRLEVAKAVSALPRPRDGEPGKSVDMVEFSGQVMQAAAKAVAALPVPQAGRDFDPEMLRLEVAKAVEAIPRPKDGLPGTSITIEDVRPVIEASVSKAELDLERRASDALQRVIDRMPIAKNGEDGNDGEDGQNGHDGFSLEDFGAEVKDGGRTLVLKFSRGERELVREMRLGIPLDRGVYKSGAGYEAGDGVTYGGSFWIAQKDTDQSPGSSADWRLSVKRGRDGGSAPETGK